MVWLIRDAEHFAYFLWVDDGQQFEHSKVSTGYDVFMMERWTGEPSVNKTEEQIEQEAQTIFGSWKSGPVVIASGSSYKMAGLKQMGMEHVTAHPAPEEVETAFFSRYENNEGRSDEWIAALVAREKVKYAIEHGAPDDALVCAFDTVVLKTDGWGDNRKRTYFEKPESREDARQSLAAFFLHIAQDKHEKELVDADMRRAFKQSPHPERTEEWIESTLAIMRPQSLIIAATGIAVRLPGDGSHIDMLPVTVRLQPRAVYAYADLDEVEQFQRSEDLAEKALSLMDEGERWRKITTGIDYTDPRIIELLQLKEVTPFNHYPPADEEVLKGMPRDGFERLLRGLARTQAEATPATKRP